MTNLGALGPDDESSAEGINDQGLVVGLSSGPVFDRAFLYDGIAMTELTTLLDSTGTGWQLTDASGINNAGQIVGTGVNPAGRVHAYLLTPNP